MEKYYIFLDFDGVVNTVYWRDDYEESKGVLKARFAYPSDGFVNNIQAVNWLNRLYKDVQYEIIVTSSWARGNDLETLTSILRKGGLNPEIPIVGKVRIDNQRTEEILEYIKITKISGHYAIVDDENFLKYSESATKKQKSILKKHLVLINPYSGITHYDIGKIEDILKNEDIIEKELY